MGTPPPREVRATGSRDLLGGLFVAGAALMFGGVVVLGKIAGRRGLPVPSLLAVRFGVAALLLGLGLALGRQTLRAAKGEGWKLVLLGSAGYAVESAMFFLALRHGTAAAVTLLFFTYPVWVALLSAALGMGLPGRLILTALATSLAGAAIVVASSDAIVISGTGVILALVAALSFSGYLVGAERVLQRTSSPAGAMFVSASASVSLATFALLSGGRLPMGAAEWVPVLGMGALTAGAFFGLFSGLRRLGAVRTSIIAAMEPVATAILALVFLDEVLPPGTIIGGALILAGAITASLARRPADPEPTVP